MYGWDILCGISKEKYVTRALKDAISIHRWALRFKSSHAFLTPPPTPNLLPPRPHTIYTRFGCALFGCSYSVHGRFVGCTYINPYSSGLIHRHLGELSCRTEVTQGIYSLRRHRLTGIGIPIINLRWSSDNLRFIIEIPIPVRRRFS